MKRFERISTIVTAASFTAILAVGGLLSVFLPKQEIIISERRKAAQLPAFTASSLFSGKLMSRIETSLLDTFPARELFRRLEAYSRRYVFRQSDTNGIFIYDGSAVAIEYPLSGSQIAAGCKAINFVTDTYLKGMNIYWSLAPDKAYYAADKAGCPAIDYDKMLSLISSQISGEYIDITGTLDLSCYYRTDSHWTQEKILGAANALMKGMGLAGGLESSDFKINTLSPFYGVYYGQAALPMSPDEIKYLTGSFLDKAILSRLESDLTFKNYQLYNTEKISDLDPYDIFMNGACPILVLENPEATTDKELYLFRDSFGSSLAPLMLKDYSKITVIDLRYIRNDLIGDYVTFKEGSDALFIYSTGTWNSGQILAQ